MYAITKKQIVDRSGEKAQTSKYTLAYAVDKETAGMYIKTCYETELNDLGDKFTIYNKCCMDTWYMISFRLNENTMVIDVMGIE